VFTVGCLDIGIQRVPLNLECLRISSFVAQPQILTVLIDNYSAICPVTPWSTLASDQFTFDDSQTVFLYCTNWLVCWHVHLWNSPACSGIAMGVWECTSPIRVIQKEMIIVGAFHGQLPLGSLTIVVQLPSQGCSPLDCHGPSVAAALLNMIN